MLPSWRGIMANMLTSFPPTDGHPSHVCWLSPVGRIASGVGAGEVQTWPIVCMEPESCESPVSRHSPEPQLGLSSQPLTQGSGSRSHTGLGYLIPGAGPRARCEEVMAGVNLPQPKARGRPLAHGCQCDWARPCPRCWGACRRLRMRTASHPPAVPPLPLAPFLSPPP